MANQFPHPFTKLHKQYQEVRKKLPAEVSNIALNEFKGNFRLGGYRTDSGAVDYWEPRKGKQQGSKRAILVKTGRLKRSLRSKPDHMNARVVTDVPYAKALNEGFKGTANVRAFKRNRYKTSRAGTGIFSVKTKKEKTKKVQSLSGSSRVKGHTRKMNLKARPFMITTKPLLNIVERHYNKQLETIFNKSV